MKYFLRFTSYSAEIVPNLQIYWDSNLTPSNVFLSFRLKYLLFPQNQKILQDFISIFIIKIGFQSDNIFKKIYGLFYFFLPILSKIQYQLSLYNNYFKMLSMVKPLGRCGYKHGCCYNEITIQKNIK